MSLRAAIVLLVVAALALAGGIHLLLPAAASPPSSERVGAAGARPRAADRISPMVQVRAALPAAGAPLTGAPDGDGRDAEPVLAPDGVERVRAAIAPAAQQCISAAVARHPGGAGRLAARYVVETRGERMRVVGAGVTLSGFDDDELTGCLSASARVGDLAAPEGQADGRQTVTLFVAVP